MEMVEFDTLALGECHTGGRFEVIENWCLEHGKNVIRIKRTPNISSSDIKNLITNE
jgi:glycerol-3-phosphate cytidylyltransferase